MVILPSPPYTPLYFYWLFSLSCISCKCAELVTMLSVSMFCSNHFHRNLILSCYTVQNKVVKWVIPSYLSRDLHFELLWTPCDIIYLIQKIRLLLGKKVFQDIITTVLKTGNCVIVIRRNPSEMNVVYLRTFLCRVHAIIIICHHFVVSIFAEDLKQI